MKTKIVTLSDIMSNEKLSFNPNDYMKVSFRKQVENLREKMIDMVTSFLQNRKEKNLSTYLTFNNPFRAFLIISQGDKIQYTPYMVNGVYIDEKGGIMLDTESEADLLDTYEPYACPLLIPKSVSLFILDIREIAYLYDKLIEGEFEDEGPEFDSAGFSISDR